MSAQPAITVEHLSKAFRVYQERNTTLKSAIMRRGVQKYRDFQALSDVSLEIPQGSTFALVGDNGSGKSTLLKCLARILVPDAGTITRRGRMAAMLEVGSGFHPELSGRDNVYLNGSILGMSKKEIDSRFDQIVDFSGVEDFIDQPVKNYSSGMYVRLGFSVAVHTEPDIMLVDEILAVGDSAFQAKCADKFAEFRRDGRTVVVVSHSIAQLMEMADHAAHLEHGQLKGVGPASTVLERYQDAARENIRIDANGFLRWGSAEALVKQVEVLNADGSPATQPFQSGSAVRLRLHYLTREPVRDPNLGVTLDTGTGEHLWACYSKDRGVHIPVIDGEGWVDLLIPDLPLQPGVFVLNAGIIDSEGADVIDFVRHVAELTVDERGYRESGGPVSMRSQWQVPSKEKA